MPLAVTALSLLKAYRSSTDEHAREVHSRLLNTLLRHAPQRTNCVYVSAAAQAAATRRGLGDLRKYHWNDQVTRLRDARRRVFMWEHFYPVAELRRRLDALKSPTVADVRMVPRRARIAWILKTEDRRQNKLGFRKKRPSPVAAYRKARIRLIHWKR